MLRAYALTRHCVHAAHIRVVDKVLPATAYLTARQQLAFDRVDFKQGNLANAQSAAKVFVVAPEVDNPDAATAGSSDLRWDWVINLAGETKYGQAEEVYEQKVLAVSVNCAHQAAACRARAYIEVSTAQVYDADKKASTEQSPLKPWTNLAKYKLKAEQALADIPGLNYVVVRPAIIYGVGDTQGITPRLIVAAAYKQLKEEMKLLWSKDLRINTVHVDDVCTALVTLADAASSMSLTSGSVWNLADRGDTTQEVVSTLIRKIFKIDTGYFGTILSSLAKLQLKDVTEESNEKHLQPWSDICKRYNVANTPLTPYIDQELLYNNSLAVDGSLIEKQTSFRYQHPVITEQSLRDVLKAFEDVGVFPENFL